MNLYNILLKYFVLSALLLAHSENAFSSALGQPEFDIVHYRLGSSGTEVPYPFRVKGLSEAGPNFSLTDSNSAKFEIPTISGDKRFSRIIFKDVMALCPETVNVILNTELVQSRAFTKQSLTQTIEVSLPNDLHSLNVIRFLLLNTFAT